MCRHALKFEYSSQAIFVNPTLLGFRFKLCGFQPFIVPLKNGDYECLLCRSLQCLIFEKSLCVNESPNNHLALCTFTKILDGLN